MYVYVFSDTQYIPECVREYVTGIGTILDEPIAKDTGQSFTIMPDTIGRDDESVCNVHGALRVKTTLFPEYMYGDRIHFSGRLSEPFNFQSDNGREFNYRSYLSKDNIYAEIRGAEISLMDEHTGDKLRSRLYEIKRTFVNALNNVLGEPHAALASGLVVGEKAALGKDLLDDFRTVGLIHIIVLSGFNITIIGEALRKILLFLPRTWGICIGAVGIVLFGIMVGGGATVVRSCLMAVIALCADLVRRDYSVIRALICAGCVMLILHPKILMYDPSFQLSFLATLGLILLASPIESRLAYIPQRFGLRGIVASTLATQLFVSPFILYMMGNISIIGMIVNILVLPLIPITMLIVFLTGLFGILWHPLSVICGWVAHTLLSYELKVVDIFSDVSYASVDVPPFSVWWMVCFYTLFTALYIYIRIKRRDIFAKHKD